MKTASQQTTASVEPSLSAALRLAHWLAALSVFYLFVTSWWMLSLPLPSQETTFRVLPFQLHKNVGITLALIVFAMLISFAKRWSGSEVSASQFLARLGHGLLYLLLVLCCLTGYLSSSYSGWGTELWWLVELPAWADENDELNELFSNFHLWICWLLLALLAVHIGAAIYHALRNDGVVERVLGSSKKSN